MKNVKNLFILLLAAFTIAACTNLEKILVFPKGTWNVDQRTKTVFIAGILSPLQTDSTTNDGTITFDKEKTGFYVEDDGDTGAFTWSYDKDTEVLTWVEDGDSLFYDVVESEFNAQNLRYEKITKVLGIEYKDIRTLKISR